MTARCRTPFALGCLLLLASCGGYKYGARTQPPPDAETRFHGFERQLLQSPGIILRYRITAEGPFEAALTGTLWVRPGNRIRLDASGSFGENRVDMLLVSDGSRMQVKVGEDVKIHDTPGELNEAVLIGLTQMGLLHNLARLTGAAFPDHSDGSVREWVQVSNIEPTRAGEEADTTRLVFDITVAGVPSGEATLAFDTGTGDLNRRTQSVRFESGEMRVVEVYDEFDLEADITPAVFQIEPR